MRDAALLVVGAALIVAATLWRRRAHRTARSRMAAALADPDASVRTLALGKILSTGLRPWSALLLRRVAEVGDDPVAAELAWLISASQWEPADDPGVAQLRLWARQYHREHVDVVTEPGPQAAAPPPAAAPSPPAPPSPAPALRAAGAPPERRPQTKEPEPASATEAERRRLTEEVEAALGRAVVWLRFDPLTPRAGNGARAGNGP